MIGEACFEGMFGECKEKIQRIVFWSSILSGAPGHSYGADAIWQFNTIEDPFGKSPSGHIWGNTPWEIAFQWPGSAHVGVGWSILSGFDWHRLQPAPSMIAPAANPDEPRHAYAATLGSDVLMIYLPEGVAPWNRNYFAKDLYPNQSYTAIYIDPLSGKRYPKMVVRPDSDGKWRLPAAPILQDWVLVIERGSE